jgi:branched-chain amino acid transport system ATP-binding protein
MPSRIDSPDQGMQTSSVLQIVDASVAFGGVAALSNVSMEARKGEIVGIIGPNGAGKTTLLNAVCGLVPLDGGKIMVSGASIGGAIPSRIAALGLARTFQTSQIFRGMTVLENVMTGMHLTARAGFLQAMMRRPAVVREEQAVEARALAALEYVGMGELASRWGYELSFGQQRLVELARALVRDPAIILLDEPGVGLSINRLAHLGNLLKRIRDEKQITLVLIEHVLRLIMHTCDRVVVLSGGVKIAEGRPDEVVADPQVVTAYLGSGFYAERAKS